MNRNGMSDTVRPAARIAARLRHAEREAAFWERHHRLPLPGEIEPLSWPELQQIGLFHIQERTS